MIMENELLLATLESLSRDLMRNRDDRRTVSGLNLSAIKMLDDEADRIVEQMKQAIAKSDRRAE